MVASVSRTKLGICRPAEFFDLTGKTVSRKLPPEEAQVLEQWIANRRETKEILDDMMAVSKKAYRLALKTEAENRDPKLRP